VAFATYRSLLDVADGQADTVDIAADEKPRGWETIHAASMQNATVREYDTASWGLHENLLDKHHSRLCAQCTPTAAPI
jgi:hypothetical protein